MGYNPGIRRRRSIRLPDFDYRTRGAYFVTICTYASERLFDDIGFRTIAERAWARIVGPPAEAGAADLVVMPNHLHGIVWITDATPVGARHQSATEAIPRRAGARKPSSRVLPGSASPLRPTAPPRGSVGAIIGTFKSLTAKRVNRVRGTPGARVWQRNYYEHVIRDDADLRRIRQYICDNPAKREDDPENPARLVS